MPRAVVLLLVLGSALPAPAAAAARPWTWPVRGDVLTPFALGPNPFAPGQHRGIDIGAPAGATVRSACTGRVRFAGRLPGRGRGVTVVCGSLVATHLELGRVTVRAGDHVAAGTPLGVVGASHVQLGARHAGRAHGYVDPLSLLRPGPPPALGPVPPAGRRDRPPRRPPGPPPAPVASPAPSPGGVPLAAWLGLAAVAGATPLGAVVRRRRSRRPSPRRAAAQRT